jgi:hypothetical protein
MRPPSLVPVCLVFAACSAPKSEPSDRPAGEDPRSHLGRVGLTEGHAYLAIDRFHPTALELPPSATLTAIAPSPAHRAALKRPPRQNAWNRESNARKLLVPIEGAHFDLERGQTLVDLLATIPEPRRSLGPTALTLATLQASCEQAGIEFSVERDGETYDGSYSASAYLNATAPVNSLYALTSTCTGAVAFK